MEVEEELDPSEAVMWEEEEEDAADGFVTERGDWMEY